MNPNSWTDIARDNTPSEWRQYRCEHCHKPITVLQKKGKVKGEAVVCERCKVRPVPNALTPKHKTAPRRSGTPKYGACGISTCAAVKLAERRAKPKDKLCTQCNIALIGHIRRDEVKQEYHR